MEPNSLHFEFCDASLCSCVALRMFLFDHGSGRGGTNYQHLFRC
jgi:hypothetical protein